MRKFLKFADGTQVELSPLTYAEFMALDLWVGASDSAYTMWLYHNKLKEAQDYRDDSLLSAEFVLDFSEVSKELEFFVDDCWQPYSEVRHLVKRGLGIGALYLKPENLCYNND